MNLLLLMLMPVLLMLLTPMPMLTMLMLCTFVDDDSGGDDHTYDAGFAVGVNDGDDRANA